MFKLFSFVYFTVCIYIAGEGPVTSYIYIYMFILLAKVLWPPIWLCIYVYCLVLAGEGEVDVHSHRGGVEGVLLSM